MSGVVFQVQASSASREVDGKRLFFCCETCATYFTKIVSACSPYEASRRPQSSARRSARRR
ncbi:MAG: TA0938 family protein [Polyangiaceae bacterium]|nr:TA0938 family protein [Polyangiaceae bacterium]